MDLNREDNLKEVIRNLPELPGVYQFYNSDDKIIYVGKAKNLKKRVTSYFNKNHDSRKTLLLVRKIQSIRHVVVDSEEDALLLENNLIKKYQPQYNVLLKDDKTYPWICLKNEPFPRVFYTRNPIRDGSSYFGPYTSVAMIRTLLEIIHGLFKIRTCNLSLTQTNIRKGNYRVCLQYQIGKCKGPCEGLQDESDYSNDIAQVREILRGNLGRVVQYLQSKMESLAKDYKFEEADEVRQKIEQLESFRSKSTIVSSTITNVDVFTIDDDDDRAFVNYIRVVDGAIVQAFNIELRKRLNESLEELLLIGIVEIKQRFSLVLSEVILPFRIEFGLGAVRQTIPIVGDKKKLLDFSQRNAKFFKLEKLKLSSQKNGITKSEQSLVTLKSDLRLPELPRRIECFDNSNIQGNYPVAACVVFINGKPAKKQYRHFNIKTVEGPNDFATMEEIIFRRYQRVIDQNEELPQLIIIDGGKGQLKSAVQSLSKLNLEHSIPIIGVAKRLEEIFVPGDQIPIYLNKNSESLRLIQQLRDEAHRFGITFHRNKRSAAFLDSQIEKIPGIGPKTSELLLKQFKSIKRIMQLSEEELTELIGVSKAKKVINYFRNIQSLK